jgi:formamidopyrimidine-DNA glycosylase
VPELPEVETTRRGILPALKGQRVIAVTIRQRQLRYPIPARLGHNLKDQIFYDVERRGKYILLLCDVGTVIIHLGMSGSLRVVAAGVPAGRHDHIDICLANGVCLRLRDPRRFGLVLWTRGQPLQHRLLCDLGPEPLGPDFDGEYLFERSRRRRQTVKQFIMDSHCVVGVGNIYASEALFMAGIHPSRAAGRISQQRYRVLVAMIKRVLLLAITQGGTTLRDFYYGDEQPGYFAQSLQVYGREGLPCSVCGALIRQRRIGQRASYYCSACQR